MYETGEAPGGVVALEAVAAVEDAQSDFLCAGDVDVEVASGTGTHDRALGFWEAADEYLKLQQYFGDIIKKLNEKIYLEKIS